MKVAWVAVLLDTRQVTPAVATDNRRILDFFRAVGTGLHPSVLCLMPASCRAQSAAVAKSYSR